MTFYNLSEFQLRRSGRNQGLPPEFTPAIGEGLMEATYQGAATNSHVGGIPVVESGEKFTSYINPLAQQPPMADTSFHPPMEGHTNSPDALEYGPDAPFWRNSMGQEISSFGVNRTSPEQTSPGEEEYRQIQASIHCARDF